MHSLLASGYLDTGHSNFMHSLLASSYLDTGHSNFMHSLLASSYTDHSNFNALFPKEHNHSLFWKRPIQAESIIIRNLPCTNPAATQFWLDNCPANWMDFLFMHACKMNVLPPTEAVTIFTVYLRYKLSNKNKMHSNLFLRPEQSPCEPKQQWPYKMMQSHQEQQNSESDQFPHKRWHGCILHYTRPELMTTIFLTTCCKRYHQ